MILTIIPCTRARQWRKKGQKNQALGRSCGRFSVKNHTTCDALGKPVRVLLTRAETSDYAQDLNLFDGLKASAVLANKSYDADYVVAAAIAIGAQPMIPPKKSRYSVRAFDKDL